MENNDIQKLIDRLERLFSAAEYDYYMAKNDKRVDAIYYLGKCHAYRSSILRLGKFISEDATEGGDKDAK
jgi:hypothetical protein